MGVVHRGVDRDSGSPVAIKTVRGTGGAERFQREVEILAALRHPGIVTYLGHGQVGDELYLVMEWLAGQDLGAQLAAHELTVGEAVGVAVQVAGALGAAHRRASSTATSSRPTSFSSTGQPTGSSCSTTASRGARAWTRSP